ncbi:MAG TPA: fumarylacetoacetate hydrolase family protein, partial [Thermomicrobiales bacterium]|nr:fumarylacetoacetate hydrolase family protein [Thermomicrobiales bacterium]
NPLSETYGILARALWEAEHAATAIDRISSVIPNLGISDGYAIRREVDLLRMINGAVPVGRKVGLATRSELVKNGVEEPYWSYLFSTGEIPEGSSIDLRNYIQPKIEAEVAFVLSHDLDDPDVSPEAVLAAVREVRPAIEIVDVRTGGWDSLASESIADSGLNAGFLLGSGIPNDGQIDPNAITARVRTSRVGTGPIGRTSELIGGPLGILSWLARKLVDTGEPLRAGEIILTGTLTPPVRLEPGQTYTAEFAGFGDALGIVRVSTR